MKEVKALAAIEKIRIFTKKCYQKEIDDLPQLNVGTSNLLYQIGIKRSAISAELTRLEID